MDHLGRMTGTHGAVIGSMGTTIFCDFVNSSNTDNQRTRTTSSMLDNCSSTSSSSSSNCGILSCWSVRRSKCHFCRCFRSKVTKFHHRDSPFTPPNRQFCQCSNGVSSSECSQAAGDSVNTNLLGYLTERDSAGSLTDTQSTIPTTLNEALKNFMRIIQRVAVPNLADQRKLDSISCLTHSRDNKGEKESSNKIYIEVLQRMESMAELTIQTAPSNINPTRNETYNSGTEVIDVSESDTPQSGLPSNRKVNEIYQNIKVSQNAATYHNQIGAQWPVGGDNFESSTMVSPSDSGTTKEISESRKNKVRRSQSLVSSLSHSRKNQWIDLESQWVDGLSVSTINSSKSLDRAIAQEVNTDSVTASEEEMAELLNDAISDFVNATYTKKSKETESRCSEKIETEEQLTMETGKDFSVQMNSSVSTRTSPTNSVNSLNIFVPISTAPSCQPSETSIRPCITVKKQISNSRTQSSQTKKQTYRRIDLCQRQVTSACKWKQKSIYAPKLHGPNAALPPVCENNHTTHRPPGNHTRTLKTHQYQTRTIVTRNISEIKRSLPSSILPQSSAAYRQLAHGIVKPCNGGDIQMVTNEHNRHNTYTEQFRLRQRMALNSNKSTKKMNTQKVTHVDLDPDKSDLTSSMGTANILALAETSDLLGDSSFRSLEKDLQNFCLESPTRKTELSDDIIPYEEHRNGKDTENQPDVTVGCNTTLIPTQRPQYRWSGVPNDSFWVSVGPPVSNMTVPCDAIHLDFRTRQLPFNSTTWFMQTAQNVPAWIPPVWMNTMDPGVIPQSGGPVIPYNYPPLSVMPPPNYLSFFAPPREVFPTPKSNRSQSLDNRTSLLMR